jgi:hypothetical protein
MEQMVLLVEKTTLSQLRHSDNSEKHVERLDDRLALHHRSIFMSRLVSEGFLRQPCLLNSTTATLVASMPSHHAYTIERTALEYHTSPSNFRCTHPPKRIEVCSIYVVASLSARYPRSFLTANENFGLFWRDYGVSIGSWEPLLEKDLLIISFTIILYISPYCLVA